MEPYEAQKMMAEIRQKGLWEAPAQPLHLYDTPYEPVLGGLDIDSDRPACPRPRESRLPEDDERPPEEYDQPWEWKKERISKAFAVEIKVIKDLPWPPPVGQLDSGESPLDGESSASVPPQHGQPSYEDANGGSRLTVGCLGKLWLALAGPCLAAQLVPGCCDASKLAQTWQGSASCLQALPDIHLPPPPSPSSSWLIHFSVPPSCRGRLPVLGGAGADGVLGPAAPHNPALISPCRSSQGFMHMKLSRTQENKYVLGQHSPPFDSVPEIIHHYASRKLPIKGAEHMSLLYPVAIRTL
ncbi:SHF protein, partial [Anhinga rufa]|nr:SHF protein [Anhinga rufa]